MSEAVKRIPCKLCAATVLVPKASIAEYGYCLLCGDRLHEELKKQGQTGKDALALLSNMYSKEVVSEGEMRVQAVEGQIAYKRRMEEAEDAAKSYEHMWELACEDIEKAKKLHDTFHAAFGKIANILGDTTWNVAWVDDYVARIKHLQGKLDEDG